MIVFGPVPSRRLGRSIGINNIPPKVCTYSCVYCQLGRTKKMEIERRDFYDPREIQERVADKMASAKAMGESVDFLTFVPDGEPTLDGHLGDVIDLIRTMGKKIAVITNASLLANQDVRDDLTKADWVSVKIDSVEETIWRKINRPHRSLSLPKILDGIVEFSEQYAGELFSETMLIHDLNDGEDQIKKLAAFVHRIPGVSSYLSVPVRPPAEKWVQPPTEDALVRAYQILRSESNHVEFLIGYEGDAFAFTGDVERDLLSITAVHPMREEAVAEFLKKADADWSTVDRLIDRGVMVQKMFQGHTFYARKLFSPKGGDLSIRMK